MSHEWHRGVLSYRAFDGETEVARGSHAQVYEAARLAAVRLGREVVTYRYGWLGSPDKVCPGQEGVWSTALAAEVAS